jgi:hypothetical protein
LTLLIVECQDAPAVAGETGFEEWLVPDNGTRPEFKSALGFLLSSSGSQSVWTRTSGTKPEFCPTGTVKCSLAQIQEAVAIP